MVFILSQALFMLVAAGVVVATVPNLVDNSLASHIYTNDDIGGCDQTCRVTPAYFFNVTAYAKGKWYMHSFRMISDPADGIRPASHRCYNVNYSLSKNPSKNIERVRYVRVNSDIVTETNNVFSIDNEEFPGIWRIRSNGVISDYTHSVILHTNYVEWSLVYTCSVQQLLGRNFRLEFVSVYTRQRFIDDTLDDFTKTLLTGLGFPPEKHTQMNQEGCVDTADSNNI